MGQWTSVGAVALLLISWIEAPVRAACGIPTGQFLTDTIKDKNGKKLKTKRDLNRLGPSLVFASGLRVNTDGAANSYHPIGTSKGALNTILNGAAVTPTSGPYANKRITAVGPESISKDVRQQLILDAVRSSIELDYKNPPGSTIDWYALAKETDGARKGKPCIQETGPYAGFFVAQTSTTADKTKPVCNPDRWVSSMTIPYVTLPGKSALQAMGARPGDIGLVHRRVAGKDIFAAVIAGDTGNQNELGEGSIALHQALANPIPAGKRLPGNISGGVTTFLFPKRQAAQPVSATTVGSLTESLLTELGGRDKLLACLYPAT